MSVGCYSDCHQKTVCKDVVAIIDIEIDWSDFVEATDHVLSSQWTISASDELLEIVETEYIEDIRANKVARIRIAGGRPGTVYELCSTVATEDGLKDRRCVTVTVHTHDNLQPINLIAGRGINSAGHAATTGGSLQDRYAGTNVGGHAALTSGTVIQPASGAAVGVHAAVTGGSVTDIVIPASALNLSFHTGITEGFLQDNASGSNVGQHRAITGGSVDTVIVPASGTATGIHSATSGGTLSWPVLSADGTNTASHAATTAGTIVTPPPDPSAAWMGIGLDPVTKRTLFDAGNVVTLVSTQLEFEAALADLKAQTIDEIQLIPLAGNANYVWPDWRVLTPLVRPNPRTHPAVIRTSPAHYTASGVRARLTDVAFSNSPAYRGRLEGLAFVDLKMDDDLGDPNYTGQVVSGSFDAGGNDVLWENCEVRVVWQSGQTYPGVDITKPFTNVCFRFNIMRNHHRTYQTHVHGYFGANVETKWEYNFIDHNGWGPSMTRSTPRSAGGPDIFKHNLYLDKAGDATICTSIFRYNYVANASSHGVHFRNGGVMEHNIFSVCPISFQFGYSGDGKAVRGYRGGTCRENIVIDADDVNTAGFLRGQGMYMDQVQDLVVDGNIFAFNSTTSINRCVFKFYNSDGGQLWHPLNVTVKNNKSIGFGTPISTTPGLSLAGVTMLNNYLEDGSVTFNDPTRVLNYHYDAVKATLDDGMTAAWIEAAVADCLDAFTVV